MDLPDEQSLALFEEVLAGLQMTHPEVVGRKMFGVPSLMVGRKPFASLNGEDMVFKLSGEALERALALPGAEPFTPMGRPMKAWVQVPPEHAELWPDLAEEALDSFLVD